MSVEKPAVSKNLEKEKKSKRIELTNGVYFDVREKSRGLYEITDLGKDQKSLKGMMLESVPKKRQFQDLENPEHKEHDWVGDSTIHFKYGGVEFDFGINEIRAPSAKTIEEVARKLNIVLVDPGDRDY